MASKRKNYLYPAFISLTLTGLWSVFALGWVAPASAAMDAAPMDEQRFSAMQAAYIYNIAKFFEWPAQQGQGTFDICLLGEKNEVLVTQLQKGTEKRQLQQLPVRILQIDSTDSSTEASQCKVLYFTQSPEHSGFTDLPQLHHQQVLRISAPYVSSSPYSQVDMVLEGNRIVLYVKAQALTESGLQAKAAFLSIAKQR